MPIEISSATVGRIAGRNRKMDRAPTDQSVSVQMVLSTTWQAKAPNNASFSRSLVTIILLLHPKQVHIVYNIASLLWHDSGNCVRFDIEGRSISDKCIIFVVDGYNFLNLHTVNFLDPLT